jgi:hypothetical protein
MYAIRMKMGVNRSFRSKALSLRIVIHHCWLIWGGLSRTVGGRRAGKKMAWFKVSWEDQAANIKDSGWADATSCCRMLHR